MRGESVFLVILSLLTACGSDPASVPEEGDEPEEEPTCIASGSQVEINAALTGVGSEAVLCQGAVFELTGSVEMTFDGQKIYTEGLPTDDRRATLRLASSDVVVAIWAEGRSNIVVESIIVDGNRPVLGHAEGEEPALLQAGGEASGQTFRHIKAFEPRAWSILHLFEGPESSRCTGALVEDNELGPAGQPDGTWADGISMACTNSTIRRNTITDATDGAIVVFGGPGSVIEDNVIRASTRTLLGGINMVDYGPYAGDYTGTRVRNNTIDAAGATIRIGIGMGPRVWWCVEDADDRVLRGASVTGNTLQGAQMQYGFAVDGVEDWTVMDNIDNATHGGEPTVDCRGEVAAPPAGFQIHRVHADGTFQQEFQDAYLELALWAVPDPDLP